MPAAVLALLLAVLAAAGTAVLGVGPAASACAALAAALAGIAYRRPVSMPMPGTGRVDAEESSDPAVLAVHRHRLAQRLAQLEQSRHLLAGVFEVGAELLACRDEVEAQRRFAAATRAWWASASAELLIWEKGRWRRAGEVGGEGPEPVVPRLQGPMHLPDGASADLVIDLSPGVDGQALLVLREAHRQPSLQELERDAERHLLEMLRSQLTLALRRVALHQELARLGRTDPLTGCWRRWYGQQRLEELVEGGAVVALAIGDIDFFKQVNDQHGHAAGDAVLTALGQLLLKSVRRGDLVYRYGGEEFAIILPDTGPLGAEQAAERMRKGIARLTGLPATVTMSFGIACCHRDESAEELLLRADAALYEAKRAGRDRVVNADALADDKLIRNTRRRLRRDDTTSVEIAGGG